MRKRKLYSDVFIVLLLLTSLIDVKSAYARESAFPMQCSIQIVDESNGKKVSGESLATLENSNFKISSNFKIYITSILKHIEDNIGERLESCGNSNAISKIDLCFVYQPLIASNSKKTPLCSNIDLGKSKSEFEYSLNSPWATIRIARSPKLILSAMFILNERQILLDQALLSGRDTSQAGSTIAITRQVFDKYVRDYTDSVLLAPSSEAQFKAKIHIEERIPMDIVWLFRHAWQSTLAPFSMTAQHALSLAMERATPRYTILINALVDQCFTSASVTDQYNNILELNEIFNINKLMLESVM